MVKVSEMDLAAGLAAVWVAAALEGLELEARSCRHTTVEKLVDHLRLESNHHTQETQLGPYRRCTNYTRWDLGLSHHVGCIFHNSLRAYPSNFWRKAHAAVVAVLVVMAGSEVRWDHKQVGKCPQYKIPAHSPRMNLKHEESQSMCTCHHLEVRAEKAVKAAKVHANSHGNRSEHHH